MDYKLDWEKSKKRFNALWNREIIDRCCIAISAPKGQGYESKPLANTKEERLKYRTDPEWIYKENKERFEKTHFLGEAFPQIFVDLGAAGHAGFFKGANYQFEDSLWFFPSINSLDEIAFDESSTLYRSTLEIAKYLVDRSEGSFFVSMPDISGNIDALAHLIGSENLMVNMLTHPDEVSEALKKVQEVWLDVSNKIYNITKDNNDGGSTIGWLSTWAEGKHAQMQSDASVMFSPELFKEFIMPELKAQSSWMDRSLYHFDGIDQNKHLDMLLSIDNLDMIQWTNVAGQASPIKYIDYFKKIQAADKCLLLSLKANEIETIMENLSSKGLYLLVEANSKEEGESILRLVEKYTRD